MPAYARVFSRQLAELTVLTKQIKKQVTPKPMAKYGYKFPISEELIFTEINNRLASDEEFRQDLVLIFYVLNYI